TDGTARLWDLSQDSSQAPKLLANKHRGPINCVAFSPDGRFCATGGEDRNICLWDTTSGSPLYTLPAGHRGGVTSIQFTPLRLLPLDGGRIAGQLESPPGSANFRDFALFSPDGRLALTAYGTENLMQLWRLPTAESRAYELRQFTWSKAPTTAAAFYPYAAA